MGRLQPAATPDASAVTSLGGSGLGNGVGQSPQAKFSKTKNETAGQHPDDKGGAACTGVRLGSVEPSATQHAADEDEEEVDWADSTSGSGSESHDEEAAPRHSAPLSPATEAAARAAALAEARVLLRDCPRPRKAALLIENEARTLGPPLVHWCLLPYVKPALLDSITGRTTKLTSIVNASTLVRPE